MRFSLVVLLFISQFAYAGTTSKSLADIALDDLYIYNPKIKLKLANDGRQQDPSRDLLVRSYLKAKAVLLQYNLDFEPWFREDHLNYIADGLTDREKSDLSVVFEYIAQEFLEGKSSLQRVLTGSRSAYLVAKVVRIDSDVIALKRLHKGAVAFALAKHEGEFKQRYGDYPYSFHLKKVRAVLSRFGFGPKESLLGLQVSTAAWLHDVIEDTDVTYKEVADLFGVEIADIVLGVTKLASDENLTKESRIRKTYERTAKNRGSRILKVADRIANVEEGLTDLFSGKPSKVHKYFNEWPLFVESLYQQGDSDSMWLHLEGLLTDKPYARSFSTKKLQYGVATTICQNLFNAI